MIFGESGMISVPRSRRYELASTVNGPKRYDATVVIGTGESVLSIALGERYGSGRVPSIRFVVVLECDGRDHIAFENIFDVIGLLDEAEHGVFKIETRIVDQIDEELGVAGVAASG